MHDKASFITASLIPAFVAAYTKLDRNIHREKKCTDQYNRKFAIRLHTKLHVKQHDICIDTHIYIYIYTVKYGQNNEQCIQNISQLEKTTYMYYNEYIDCLFSYLLCI